MPEKSVFTTGQIAKLIAVAPRTVSKWCDSGQLECYRIPGGGDRRVTRANLVRFLKANRFPTYGLDGGEPGLVAVVGLSAEQAASLRAAMPGATLDVFATECEAAAGAERRWPSAVVMAPDGRGDRFGCPAADSLARHFRGHSTRSVPRLVALHGGVRPSEDLFDDLFRVPFDADLLAARLDPRGRREHPAA